MHMKIKNMSSEKFEEKLGFEVKRKHSVYYVIHLKLTRDNRYMIKKTIPLVIYSISRHVFS